jgi:hypothetical protein
MAGQHDIQPSASTLAPRPVPGPEPCCQKITGTTAKGALAFCGAPSVRGLSYCKRHRRLIYQAGTAVESEKWLRTLG